MKTQLIFFTLLGFTLCSIADEVEKLESLTTVDGKTYNGVTIRQVTEDGIRIIHDSGATSIAFDNLPVELKDIYIKDAPVKEAPIPAQKISMEQALAPIPIAEWAGHKFVFIPLSEYEQKNGYIIKKSPTSDISRIPYRDYVGKVITILKVEREQGSFASGYNIFFQVDATGERLITTTLLGNVKGIVLKRDYDYATSEFLDKTLWLRNNNATSLNPDPDDFGSIKVKNLQPVTVTKIRLSDSESWPIQFFLKTQDGQEFTKVSKISGTNSDTDPTRLNAYHFSEVFFLEDPRKIFDWDERTFEAIADGKLFVGMTKEQARISWGNPIKVNRTVGEYGTREQWIYGGQAYVYFDDDKLSAIQQ
jgi:hypothetical protein